MVKKNYNLGRKVLAKKVSEDYKDVYDSTEFDLTSPQTNYNVKVNVPELFNNIKNIHSLIIKTNKAIGIRLNSIINPLITIGVKEKELAIGKSIGFEVTNIYLTNTSGLTATIKISLFE